MACQSVKIFKLPHHQQQELCTTRASYRQGRKLTAVKVYTANNESNHLLIYGVPSIGLLEEVTTLCRRFGDIRPVQYVEYPDKEEFTDVFHVTYKKIQAARFAKNQLDTKNFFGNVLHVFYAPELETVAETRNKLITRRKEVAQKINKLQRERGNKEDIYKKNFETKQKRDDIEANTSCSMSLSTCISSEEQTIPTEQHRENIPSPINNQSSLHNMSSDTSTYSVSNANQGESIANFYKIYSTPPRTTQESPIGPILPTNNMNANEAEKHDKAFHELANSNPYRTNAPFIRETLESGKDKRLNLNNSNKRKYKETQVDFPNEIKKSYTRERDKNSNDCDNVTTINISHDGDSTKCKGRFGSNSNKQDPNCRSSTTQCNCLGQNSPSNLGKNFKFKFIPRQVISNKKT